MPGIHGTHGEECLSSYCQVTRKTIFIFYGIIISTGAQTLWSSNEKETSAKNSHQVVALLGFLREEIGEEGEGRGRGDDVIRRRKDGVIRLGNKISEDSPVNLHEKFSGSRHELHHFQRFRRMISLARTNSKPPVNLHKNSNLTPKPKVNINLKIFVSRPQNSKHNSFEHFPTQCLLESYKTNRKCNRDPL